MYSTSHTTYLRNTCSSKPRHLGKCMDLRLSVGRLVLVQISISTSFTSSTCLIFTLYDFVSSGIWIPIVFRHSSCLSGLISKLCFVKSVLACLLVRFQGLADCLVFWLCSGGEFLGLAYQYLLQFWNLLATLHQFSPIISNFGSGGGKTFFCERRCPVKSKEELKKSFMRRHMYKRKELIIIYKSLRGYLY